MADNLKVSQLIPDDKNYNKGNAFGNSLIEKSLRKFGAGRSILLDKNNRIIAGNKTVENAGAIGMEDVIVVETTGNQIVAVKRTDVDLDSAEGRELALADNATAKANIEWDSANIAKDWDLDGLKDWGVELRFDKEAYEDDYEIPAEIETDIKIGDLIEIGQHRLLCGDSTNADDFLKLMGSEKYDIIVTDPPYNVDYTGGTKSKLKIENDKMSDADFKEFLYNHFVSIGLSSKDGAVFYVFQPDKQIHNFLKAFIEAGNKYSGLLIWKKDSIVMSRGDYHSKHETITYGWKEGAAHGWYADRKQASVLEFERPKRNEEHPTMKPVPLIGYLISNSSKNGDLIGDGFLGSGTTMVAAHQLNRKCYGMEIDPKYCQVIIDRMQKLDPSVLIKINGETYETQRENIVL